MSKYTGVKCPICEQKFTDGDDIVVCPVCGTPYHRTCYQKAGSCVNQKLHETHTEWSEQGARAQEETKYDASLPLRCPKCGTVNPSDGIFCQICGSRLGEGSGPHAQNPTQNPDPITLNPFTTPYGGVSPDEEIDGVSVRDIALYVGENSHYFIPKFKSFSGGGRHSTWNWPAFLFRGYYFLYRKMYGLGVALLLITAAIGLPALLINLALASQLYNLPLISMAPATFDLLNKLRFAGSLLSALLSVGCAILFNRAYCRKVIRSVKKIQKQFGGDLYAQDYILALTKRGRTNRMLILVLLLLLLAGSMAMSLLMVMFLV
ncbi:RING finger protein [Harryflintia acetispora]|uniref:Uncharacterized protein DUF2628 n=1 Tax=Harryflintia acetispora TaxID=1849041 RepID=A0A9X8Y8B0_9FIRM|nr:RING finger protein [Harryflintia acetispora]TCL43547.1 uncharacterized protein DUF2628 [Harryflintia acetispora]